MVWSWVPGRLLSVLCVLSAKGLDAGTSCSPGKIYIFDLVHLTIDLSTLYVNLTAWAPSDGRFITQAVDAPRNLRPYKDHIKLPR